MLVMDEPTKICPRCGAEYLPKAIACADCGVALVWTSQYNRNHQQPELLNESLQLPRGRQTLSCVCWDSLPVIEELAGRLQDAGIPFRIEEEDKSPELHTHADWIRLSSPKVYSLSVLPNQFDEAVAVVESFRAERGEDIPGAAGTTVVGDARHNILRCPACGAELADGDRVCPDCELHLPGAEESDS